MTHWNIHATRFFSLFRFDIVCFYTIQHLIVSIDDSDTHIPVKMAEANLSQRKASQGVL